LLRGDSFFVFYRALDITAGDYYRKFYYTYPMKIVRAAMIGDVVGEPGLKALERKLPQIIKDNAVDFTVVNGENSADGFGMTETALKRIVASGADAVTSGNHVWEKRDFWNILEAANNALRPANYPAGTAGRGWLCSEKAGISWVIINLQGREYMTPIDCPFRCFDDIAKRFVDSTDSAISPMIIVDFHAESSREKEAFGYYLDGRAALVAGTHTHVQTADERILPKGTAYITDLGMTGITSSVIGMDAKICLDRTRKQVLYRMEPAADNSPNGESSCVQGIIAEFNAETGKALSVRRI
jgi:metallophosphoesterase (TIGR00282 family)